MPARAAMEELFAAGSKRRKDVLEIGHGRRDGPERRRIERAAPGGEKRDESEVPAAYSLDNRRKGRDRRRLVAAAVMKENDRSGLHRLEDAPLDLRCRDAGLPVGRIDRPEHDTLAGGLRGPHNGG